MSEKVDVAVVGAGLAGLGAAYHLAAAGLDVLVVERGDYPGSKNMTGGRLYLNPVRSYYPDLFHEKNLGENIFERKVVKERLTMMSPSASTTLEFTSRRFEDTPDHSVTILRGVFDRWLGEAVSEAGAMVVPGYKVDELIIENEKVAGIVSSGDEIRADMVLATDGSLSFIAEQAGLRKRHDPDRFALGIKSVIELDAEKIEDRFGLASNQGMAQLFFGDLTQGMTGGGFLYTNRNSLSVGIVLGMGSMLEKGDSFQAHELFETFISHSEVAPLIADGELVEYSAHAIPESNYQNMSGLVRDGLIVAGDAAGLSLNMGITVRGMDFALASGALAAQTIISAKEFEDFSAGSLSKYEDAMRKSFVLQDQNTFKSMLAFLENKRLYQYYPNKVSELLESLFWIGDQSKESFLKTVVNFVRKLSFTSILGDLWKARKL